MSSLSEERKLVVEQYLSIVEATMFNQGKIMESYEGLVKKLETQVLTCQAALDESTKREIEQLEIVMQLKLAIEERKQERALKRAHKGGEKEAKPPKKECQTCQAYEMEGSLLREQITKQQEVIDKLSEAQELLLLQYKVLEIGVSSEIGNIQKAQLELEALKADFKDDVEEEAEPAESPEAKPEDKEDN